MRVLLVEPEYRKGSEKLASECRRALASINTKGKKDDDRLWYPPLGLMKLASFHKQRGDEVHFVVGCDRSVLPLGLFDRSLWDRVYISTLFTFHFDTIVKTINFYKEAVGGTNSKIFVGGIMSTLMPQDIFNETGIFPISGILTSAKQIGIDDDTNIDQLVPDYEILSGLPYAINDTFYAYTSRGCVNRCAWCGVPKVEPLFQPYYDIKPIVQGMRRLYGDKAHLKLMDNNILASPLLNTIVEDLLTLGYGKNEYTNTQPKKQRTVDFNQGVDASFINKETIALLAKLNIKPLRIAFDRFEERELYLRAVNFAIEHGFTEISNYMLYNFLDTPFDLFQRLMINISLNKQYSESAGRISGLIYCYPMRFAPINDEFGSHLNRKRDLFTEVPAQSRDWLENPAWTKRFVRNVEIMKSAVNGAISPTYELALRTVGENFCTFMSNLYMPEELIRNRNKHEKRLYEFEPKRKPGTGKIEAFRDFILELLKARDERFVFFHNAVTPNIAQIVRYALNSCSDKEMKKWLELYLYRS